MQLHSLTRLTNAFSKKVDNLKSTVSLHLARYNLYRRQQSIRVTPAMVAGIVDNMWSIQDLLRVADRAEL
jgi:hypothetical protein